VEKLSPFTATRLPFKITGNYQQIGIIMNPQPVAAQVEIKPAIREKLNNRKIIIDKLARNYEFYVPSSYNGKKALPLVLMFHGAGGTGRGASFETGWLKKAESEGFFMAFPNALPRYPDKASNFRRNPQLWNDGSKRFYSEQNAVDDIAFVKALIQDLETNFRVDSKRIYATGFSNGASMTFKVGAELSSLIAAIAPTSGALWLDGFTLSRPVSMCYITGSDDPLNILKGGAPKLVNGSFDSMNSKPKPAVRESIEKWLRVNGQSLQPNSIQENNGVRREVFAGPKAEVLYITIEGMGHAWAGGKSLLPESMVGPSSNKLDATSEIWNFFQKHQL
jgi:polyhydroxybutyrate depolymerase